ncbi:MAG TPA: hypothetical protein VKM55_23155 [Candidatus Lokiarchaeia archaeon]|nr:hypothetical protein [Candidatus Lokiarchaeia archaeon]
METDEADKSIVDLLEIDSDEIGLPKTPSATLYGQVGRVLYKRDCIDWLDIFLLGFPIPTIDTMYHIAGFVESALHLTRARPELSLKELRDMPQYALFKERSIDMFYLYSPTARVLATVEGKDKQFFVLDIFTDNFDLTRGIARFINSQYFNGIIEATNWRKLERAFHFQMNIDECIDTWAALLESPV